MSYTTIYDYFLLPASVPASPPPPSEAAPPWQPFCQAGMLLGELRPYGVEIGPSSPNGLKYPYHLQKLLAMQPGTFGKVEQVLLDVEQSPGSGRMLFRQGLHKDGWTAIFQQRYLPP